MRKTSFFLLFLFPILLNAQTVIKGKVLHVSSLEPLPFISIGLKGTAYGTRSKMDGSFGLKTNEKQGELVFSYLGFRTKTVAFTGSDSITIIMEEDPKMLSVSITAKAKYRNKENPAVELIRQVIEHKDLNRQKSTPNIQYDEYEKIKISLINPSKKIVANPLFKRYQFMMENMDTLSIPGKKVLPFYLEEKFYHRYFKQNPSLEKSLLKADKKIEFDPKLINNDGISTTMKYLYQNIDIYKNNIYFLTNSFLSPIADMAPTFYKFYIQDTAIVEGVKLVRLKFAPRNTTDLLFSGELMITLDGNFAVENAALHLNKNSAINWVNELKVTLDFEKQINGKYYNSYSETSVNFGLDGFKSGLLASRSQTFKNYETNTEIPDFIFSGPKEESIIEDKKMMETYLEQQRPEQLNTSESKTYSNYDSLNSMKSFNRTLLWGSFFFSGYLNLKKVEIGPWGSFFSGNPVEGFKLRVAARTTEELNKNFYFSGNLGHGFKNQKWTHYLSGAYAFNHKSIYTFPQHFIRFSHANDIRIPGLDIQFQSEQNPLMSIKRGVNNQFLYDDIWQLNYIVESKSHLRLEASLKKWNQETAGALHYIRDENGLRDTTITISTTEAAILLRYAPGEQIFDQKETRKPVPNRLPVFMVGLNMGIPHFLEGQYDYQKLQIKINKRFILSQLGHADVEVAAGYLWGKVPYPFLFIPKANQSYGYMLKSYNLMNFMEFVNDQYIDFKIDYHLHGFILNKIPLIQKLKLREVMGIKGVYGYLREENQPKSNSGLFEFPRNENTFPTTFAMNKTPYLEANIGVENIFNFFRIDYVRRLNYLDHPNISKWGIRVGLQLTL